jgi:hypothetical protein
VAKRVGSGGAPGPHVTFGERRAFHVALIVLTERGDRPLAALQ